MESQRPQKSEENYFWENVARPLLAGIRGTESQRTKGWGGPAGRVGRVSGGLRGRSCSPGRNADHTYAPGQARAGWPGSGRGCEGGTQERRRKKRGRQAADHLPIGRPRAHLRSVSRAPSCLSSGRPRAARRSLLSSSAARQYWACSSPPLGYVCWMNFTSGLARSTSEVFFSCTEINVAMARTSAAVRAKQTAGRRRESKRADYPAGGPADRRAVRRCFGSGHFRELPRRRTRRAA